MHSRSTDTEGVHDDRDAPHHEEVRVCRLADLKPDKGVQVLIEGREPIALWRVADKVFATDDTCTHGKASLAEDGYLEGHTIECGMHQGCFDVRNGRALVAPCTVALRTYQVEVRDGDIYITLHRLA